MKDNLEFIDRLRRITKERIRVKDRYERCCNDPDLKIDTKEIMLNNFDVAYLSLGHARDELIKHYMEEKL